MLKPNIFLYDLPLVLISFPMFSLVSTFAMPNAIQNHKVQDNGWLMKPF